MKSGRPIITKEREEKLKKVMVEVKKLGSKYGMDYVRLALNRYLTALREQKRAIKKLDEAQKELDKAKKNL